MRKLELTNIIDVLTGAVIVGIGYFLKSNVEEQKRIEILLNKTREEYATRTEVRDDMRRVMEALHRVEDKLDKVLSK